MYNQDPRALSGLGAWLGWTLDLDLATQVNKQISSGDWFDFKFTWGTDPQTVTIKSLNQFMTVMAYTVDLKNNKQKGTDGSFQAVCKYLSDNGFIPSAKADKWLGYWNNYWTLVWYKAHPGQQLPAGGVPTPSASIDIFSQILAWLKGQGTSGTTTTTTNAGFLGTYGIPIIALVGGVVVLGMLLAPKKGGAATATVPLVKPTIKYRYRAKRRK